MGDTMMRHRRFTRQLVADFLRQHAAGRCRAGGGYHSRLLRVARQESRTRHAYRLPASEMMNSR